MAHAVDTLTRALKATGAAQDPEVMRALEHLGDCEAVLVHIAARMAGSDEWGADLMREIALDVADIAPNPGSVLEGRDETGTGPAERYVHEMSEFGFTIYQGTVLFAQALDDGRLGEREGDES